MNKIYSFDLPASPSHEQFPLAKCRCKHLISKLSSYVCNKSFVMFPTVKNSLSVGVFSCERIAAQFPPLWRKILLRRGQRKVRLSEGRPILVTFSPFSSTSRGNKHIFRAYPSTLKIAELCFETTAANSTIIWSARLGFLPLREAGTGFVGVLTHPSTHFWSSRKHYIVHGNNAQDCFRYSWLFWVRLHIFRNFSWIIALWHGVRKKKKEKRQIAKHFA